MSRSLFKTLLLSCIWLSACAPSQPDVAPSLIEIDLGKSKPERLLQFYFGGFASETAANPFETGLLIETEGHFYLDRDLLSDELLVALVDEDQNRIIVWDELEPFLQATYYQVRPAPPTLDALIAETGFMLDDPAWLEVGVDGVMTTARRHVFVKKSAVRAALAGYSDNNQQLRYPVNTVFIGDHRDSGQTLETTVMRKREDGFWDYFVYDASGNLAPATSTPPRSLAVPTRCVGCHFGEKKFEPENSFPLPSTPGPNGPRAIHVTPSADDTSLVNMLDEHNKRSDTILGLYATIYLSQLHVSSKAGEALNAADQEILKKFVQSQ